MSTTDSHAFHHAPMGACPFMPVFGPPRSCSIAVEAPSPVGLRRQAIPRLPRRHRRGVARPLERHRRRSGRGPGRDTAARVELLRQPGGDRSRGEDQRAPEGLDGPRRSGLLHEFRRRVQRVRHQTRPKARRTRTAHGRRRRSAASTAGPWRHSQPPASRPNTSRSRRCPKGSVTSRGVTSTRCVPPSTDRSPP